MTHNKKVPTCEKNANGEMVKDYAAIGAERDERARTTISQMEGTYRLRNERKNPQIR